MVSRPAIQQAFEIIDGDLVVLVSILLSLLTPHSIYREQTIPRSPGHNRY
jgi:hypothetical protein